jgi:hypothetical protein
MANAESLSREVAALVESGLDLAPAGQPLVACSAKFRITLNM